MSAANHCSQPRRGDAVVRRHIRRWRYVTAQLQVLLNSGAGPAAVADEAHAIGRQCQHLAEAMRQLSTHAGLAASAARADAQLHPQPRASDVGIAGPLQRGNTRKVCDAKNDH